MNALTKLVLENIKEHKATLDSSTVFDNPNLPWFQYVHKLLLTQRHTQEGNDAFKALVGALLGAYSTIEELKYKLELHNDCVKKEIDVKQKEGSKVCEKNDVVHPYDKVDLSFKTFQEMTKLTASRLLKIIKGQPVLLTSERRNLNEFLKIYFKSSDEALDSFSTELTAGFYKMPTSGEDEGVIENIVTFDPNCHNVYAAMTMQHIQGYKDNTIRERLRLNNVKNNRHYKYVNKQVLYNFFFGVLGNTPLHKFNMSKLMEYQDDDLIHFLM